MLTIGEMGNHLLKGLAYTHMVIRAVIQLQSSLHCVAEGCSFFVVVVVVVVVD